MSLGCFWGVAAPAKQNPGDWLVLSTQGQALSRRRLRAAKYKSNERNRVYMFFTEHWALQEKRTLPELQRQGKILSHC